MMFLIRTAGYFVAMAVVDIAVDYWEVRKMRREMTRYENQNDGAVSAHVVTDDTAGPVMTVGGTTRDAVPGDVLIGTDRPDVYHVADGSALEGYSEAADSDSGASDTVAAVSGDPTDDDQDSDRFDPSEVSASEVRAYLDRQRSEGNRAEYDRVADAERAGRNRSTALVAYDR